MKYILPLGLLVFSSLAADAQKNNFFGDIGMTGGAHYPGASFTYNRKTRKHIGIGAGVQGYDYTITDRNSKSSHRFMPAVYADLRAYVPVRKRSLFFFMTDLGVNIYRNEATYYEMAHSNGFYMGLGFGYCYRVTKLGVGLYASVKLATDSYTAKQVDPLRSQPSKVFSMDGTPIFSLGVKF